MSVWKSGITSSFESPLPSSKPAQSMLALLIPGSTSLLAGTLDEGAHANSSCDNVGIHSVKFILQRRFNTNMSKFFGSSNFLHINIIK